MGTLYAHWLGRYPNRHQRQLESALAGRQAVQPRALILSTDSEVMAAVKAADTQRRLELQPWPYTVTGFAPLAQVGVRLVVIDDSDIVESERAWLVRQVRRLSPDARLVYLAEGHSPDSELQVRQSGVDYYVSKPYNEALLARVLKSFISSIS